MVNEKDIAKKAYSVFLAICVIAIAIIGKVFWLQAFPSERAQQIAKNFVYQIKTIESQRGQIFSSDHRLLATSIPEYAIHWDSKSPYDHALFSKKIDSLATGMYRLFGTHSPVEYKRLFSAAKSDGERYALIEDHVGFVELQKFKELPFVREGLFRAGFAIEEKNKRVKPLGALAARTIGLEREDNKVGLELAYDSLLSGKEGKQLQEKIAGGIWKPMTDDYIVQPEPGYDLVSTIDVHLQDVAQAALMRQLVNNNAAWGCAVLMEVETGYVRAIANLAKNEKTGEYEESLNLAISQSVEPGSTFKLMSLMACLDEGLIELTDSVATGKGSASFYGHEMKDSNWDKGGNGTITTEQVFEKSSNIGTALLVKKSFENNKQKFLDKLHQFGINETLHLDLAGEGKPRIYSSIKEKGWSGLSLTQLAIGYETQMTPLQTLAFYNAIANDGKLMKPLFVQEIQSGGHTVQKIRPQVIRKDFCKKQTLKMCHQMMEGVMEKGGTAEETFKNSPYTVAGKTGTAWLNEKGGYQAHRFRASFVGYFPANDPKYSCIVVIHDPRSGNYYGSTVAAPVFKELADKIYSTQLDFKEEEVIPDSLALASRRIPVSKSGNSKDLETVFRGFKIPIENNSESDWVSTSTSKDTVKVSTRTIKEGLVPNVVGMGLQDALYILENQGMKVKVFGYGTVKRQSVQAGVAVKNSPYITIELS